MIAAIYARKSTDQSSVAEDQKSVARQIEHARAFAAKRGWSVADAHVYVDDGISGAEFDKRPGLQRLRAALRPRPPFSIVVVSEQSRLSRDMSDTLQLLKEFARAGVQVFAYQDGRAISIDTPNDSLMTTIGAWKDSEARRESSVRTHEAMARKALAAHVTGGRVFGYRNVDIYNGIDVHGRPLRSHVGREIRDDEAAIVRQIFQLCASGLGVKRIAARLNEQGAPCPRAQQRRVAGWAPSSVRSVLYRDTYRGQSVWNKTKKRNAFGQAQVKDRAESEWLRRDVPAWRIVPDDLWTAAHQRLTAARQTYLAGTDGNRWGRPTTGTESKYLLTGLVRCGVCGGGMTVRSRDHGKGRSFRYVCSSHHYRGCAICGNGLEALLEAANAQVLDWIEEDLLRPSVIEPAIEMALDTLLAERAGAGNLRRDLDREIAAVDGKIAKLTEAIEQGGQLGALVAMLQTREAERTALQARQQALETLPAPFGPRARLALDKHLRALLKDWRGTLRGNVPEARQVLQVLLADRLTFTPAKSDDGAVCFHVKASFALGRVVGGLLSSQGGTSPAGFEPALPA